MNFSFIFSHLDFFVLFVFIMYILSNIPLFFFQFIRPYLLQVKSVFSIFHFLSLTAHWCRAISGSKWISFFTKVILLPDSPSSTKEFSVFIPCVTNGFDKDIVPVFCLAHTHGQYIVEFAFCASATSWVAAGDMAFNCYVLFWRHVASLSILTLIRVGSKQTDHWFKKITTVIWSGRLHYDWEFEGKDEGMGEKEKRKKRRLS